MLGRAARRAAAGASVGGSTRGEVGRRGATWGGLGSSNATTTLFQIGCVLHVHVVALDWLH